MLENNNMQFNVNSNPSNLEPILERIFANRRITRKDQQIMMSSFLTEDGLSDHHLRQINKVFDALKGGLIKVVDLH
ncbi:hypothetical protein [Trichormus azollae]|jgi:hypothetical protein|uniref:Uncharacterized protein n=1 Tax=Nostoc azollae (strain 0708) TaxID=551115 RepID=D7E4K1_NOSA0|nr:hypothetical protein [Trichormus azollae]ADI63759.1 conserved hypothetical protein ['Nostoc azollae' 0708]